MNFSCLFLSVQTILVKPKKSQMNGLMLLLIVLLMITISVINVCPTFLPSCA